MLSKLRWTTKGGKRKLSFLLFYLYFLLLCLYQAVRCVIRKKKFCPKIEKQPSRYNSFYEKSIFMFMYPATVYPIQINMYQISLVNKMFYTKKKNKLIKTDSTSENPTQNRKLFVFSISLFAIVIQYTEIHRHHLYSFGLQHKWTIGRYSLVSSSFFLFE